MKFSMFLEFPGILILIGVVLLIIAIVIGVIAYKSPKDEDLSEITTDEIKESDEIKEQAMEEIPESIEETENVPINNELPEVSIEQTSELETNEINEEQIQKPDDYIEEKVEEEIKQEPLKETNEVKNTEDITEDLTKIIDVIDETKFNKKPESNNESISLNEHEKLTDKIEDKPIYGGTDPLKNIDLNFEEIKREPYSENSVNLDNTEELINVLNIDKKKETIPEIIKNDEEEIEEL